MFCSLNNNINATDIFRNLNLSHALWAKAAEKLSSGLKINRASDDPAGLVISEQMRSRIASLNQEISNISGQINKYETASSQALQLRGILTEIRSLAVAASNDGFNDPAIQDAYQTEANRLVETYNFVVENAAFGEQKLFDGSDGSLATIAKLGPVDLSDTEAAQSTIESIDEAASRLDATISDMGATQRYDLESRMSSLQVEAQNLTAAESQIRDTDYVLEFANLLKNQILIQSSVSLLAHSFISPQSVLALMIER